MMIRSLMKAMLATALLAVAVTTPVQANGAVADLTAAAVETRLLVETTPAPTPAKTTPGSAASAPAPTPAATTPAKKKKKSKGVKKCESGLEPLPEDAAADSASTENAVIPADNTTANALSMAADAAEAPPAVVAGESTTTEANTKTDGAESSGLGGGVIAAVVVAGVMAVAVGAVAMRKRAEHRRRANTLRTPVEAFGQVNATPAQVTIL